MSSVLTFLLGMWFGGLVGFAAATLLQSVEDSDDRGYP